MLPQATSQTPMVYAELDFDEDKATSAKTPVIHCRQEPTDYTGLIILIKLSRPVERQIVSLLQCTPGTVKH